MEASHLRDRTGALSYRREQAIQQYDCTQTNELSGGYTWQSEYCSAHGKTDPFSGNHCDLFTTPMVSLNTFTPL